MFHEQLVLLVGTKLQHVIATLALENAGITRFFPEAKLRPRDELFWFNKPELLLSLIHFILFQVGHGLSTSYVIISCWNLLLMSDSLFFLAECIWAGFILLVLGISLSTLHPRIRPWSNRMLFKYQLNLDYLEMNYPKMRARFSFRELK